MLHHYIKSCCTYCKDRCHITVELIFHNSIMGDWTHTQTHTHALVKYNTYARMYYAVVPAISYISDYRPNSLNTSDQNLLYSALSHSAGYPCILKKSQFI